MDFVLAAGEVHGEIIRRILRFRHPCGDVVAFNPPRKGRADPLGELIACRRNEQLEMSEEGGQSVIYGTFKRDLLQQWRGGVIELDNVELWHDRGGVCTCKDAGPAVPSGTTGYATCVLLCACRIIGVLIVEWAQHALLHIGYSLLVKNRIFELYRSLHSEPPPSAPDENQVGVHR